MRELTILRESQSPGHDAAALALGALGWILADRARADRLLALTGLTPDALRSGLGDPGVLGAVLDFLASHEPDLLAAAEELGIEPAALMAARERL
ncbi:DUF3572 domain-containing protein [Novosphingobium sp.]|uniref:DUF3572 domain-containing protein n=1 Tax=Novosphingobium sp. TaxID=1874826 RepID=UPI0035AFF825